MSSLFGNLFGKKDTAVQTQKTGFETLPDFAQQLARDITTKGQGIAGSTSAFSPIGLTGQQQGALSQLAGGVQAPTIGSFDFGQRASQEFGRAGDFLGQAQNAFGRFDPTLNSALASISAGQDPITGEQLQQGISEFINPFTQQVIDPAVRDIEEAGARRQSQLAGQLSGSLGAFQGARGGIESGLIQRDVGREVGRVGGQLRSQAFNTASQQALSRLTGERERSLQGGQLGLGALGQITGQAGQLGGLAGQAGGLGQQLFGARQGIEGLRGDLRNRQVQSLQEQLAAGDVTRQLEGQTQQIPVQQLQLLQNILAGIPVGGGGGQLRENQGALQRIGDAAGGISAIGSLFASDKNLKENIKHIGKENGFNIYEFNYKGIPNKFTGVMAQEVQVKRPDAVVTINGYLAVDYSKIGIEMKEVA